MRRLKIGVTTMAVVAWLTVITAFVQNLRRGHTTPATDTPAQLRLPAAFTELALAV
jgi:hypothetical protein